MNLIQGQPGDLFVKNYFYIKPIQKFRKETLIEIYREIRNRFNLLIAVTVHELWLFIFILITATLKKMSNIETNHTSRFLILL